jgi:hypothetical protein
MEVHSYRDDNERIIKYQEEHNHINTQLIQSLNQLQRKIKVESGPRHEEEGRPHARRENYKRSRHSRSASRTHRHHHSPTHSVRKLYSSTES